MSFFEEIEQISGIPLSVLRGGFRIVNFSGKAVFVEGINGILSFSTERVSLKIKRGICEICGSNLFVASLSKDDILLKGQIESISQKGID